LFRKRNKNTEKNNKKERRKKQKMNKNITGPAGKVCGGCTTPTMSVYITLLYSGNFLRKMIMIPPGDRIVPSSALDS
jgi:hypothetical protein